MQSINERFERIESELAVSKQVNKLLKKRLIEVEKNSYANEQYSRRECFEIVDIPTTVEQHKLEETVCNLFSKIGSVVPPEKIEAVHRIGRDKKKRNN